MQKSRVFTARPHECDVNGNTKEDVIHEANLASEVRQSYILYEYVNQAMHFLIKLWPFATVQFQSVLKVPVKSKDKIYLDKLHTQEPPFVDYA